MNPLDIYLESQVGQLGYCDQTGLNDYDELDITDPDVIEQAAAVVLDRYAGDPDLPVANAIEKISRRGEQGALVEAICSAYVDVLKRHADEFNQAAIEIVEARLEPQYGPEDLPTRGGPALPADYPRQYACLRAEIDRGYRAGGAK